MDVKKLPVKISCILIRCYQICLSPYFGQQCRFTPTCSEFTKEAIEKFGATRGMYLGIKRILRCQPYSEGGYDPVPCQLPSSRND